jgi:hypothetical protein
MVMPVADLVSVTTRGTLVCTNGTVVDETVAVLPCNAPIRGSRDTDSVCARAHLIVIANTQQQQRCSAG